MLDRDSAEIISVLLIEDNPFDARMVQEMLAKAKGASFDLECVDRLSTGLERLAKGGIDLVLLNLFLPESQGHDTLSKVCARAPQVPVVVMTGLADEVTAIEAVHEGAQDYFIKSQVEERYRLVRSILYAIERKHMEQELREAYDNAIQHEIAERMRKMVELEQGVKKLQASEERFRNIIEKNADGIIIVDRKGVVKFVNPALESLFGRKAEDFMDQSFGFPLAGGETVELGILGRGGKPTVAEMRVVETTWDGEEAYLASMRDITERKQAENALVASKAYTESIIQNFLDTLIVVDVEAKIQTVNPATCHLLGYTEKELIGQPISMIFAKEEEEEEEANRMFQFFREPEKSKALSLQDTIRNIELHYKTKDGRLVPMSFNASVLTDEAGNVRGVVGGAKDLTEIKLAEESRRKSEERFRKVIENIFEFVPEGLLTFTNKLNLFRINKAFRDVVQKYSAGLNYTEQELTEIIIEQVKNRIINEDYTEIRIPKKQRLRIKKDEEAKNRQNNFF